MDSEIVQPRQDRRGASRGQFGQQPFVPTDQQRADVRAWAKITDADTIARQLDISRDTLDRHFKKELQAGRFEAVGAVGGKLLKKAMDGNMTAMIFYLRTQGKWNTRIEHTGLDGGPISMFDASGFLSDLSVEEQRLMRPVLLKMLAAAGVSLDGEDDATAAG